MKVLSLFSGVGLGDLGLMMAGMEIAGQVEIDDYCQKILNLRWPDVPKWKDIKLVKPEELPTADLISGGFPCQPFSVAGKRRGKKDDRHLWPQMARIIEAKRPTWVLGENVPGIIKMGLDEVLSDLENIGYACRTFNIPACATDADHKRARIWIIANSGNVGWDEGADIPGKKCKKTGRNKFTVCGEMVADSSNARIEGMRGWENKTDEDVADPINRRSQERRTESEGPIIYERHENMRSEIKKFCEDASKSFQPGLEGHAGHVSDGNKPRRLEEKSDRPTGESDLQYRERWRLLESGIRRVAHGVPNRVDRIKALGNGQHVHTVYEIGRLIMKFELAGKKGAGDEI